jgi:gamma-glutamyltranspeptidase/glutathione hydrolase
MRLPSKSALPFSRNPLKPWLLLAVIGLPLAIHGCGGGTVPGKGGGGDSVSGGIVVADEPLAALAGRDVLGAGGSAADAAVVTGFTLAVTLPSSAGLGGSGSCLVWDAQKKSALLLDLAMPEGVPTPIASPGTARLLATLHTRYGRLAWSQLVSPAETMARFPQPASRAFAHELAAAAPDIRATLASQKLFTRADGQPIREGDPVAQVELGALLSQIRLRGAGVLYSGPLARELAAASGGTITTEMLDGTLPRWRDPASLAFQRNHIAYFTPEPPSTGQFARRLFSLLTNGHDYGAAPEGERPHLLAEAMAHAGAGNAAVFSVQEAQAAMAGYRGDQHQPVAGAGADHPGLLGATGFITADRAGEVVACELHMNAAFGTGHVVPRFGFLSAPRLDAPVSGVAAMMTAAGGKDIALVAAAGAGPAGAAALDAVALAIFAEKRPLEDALARPRIWQPADADILYAEPGAAGDELARRGHRLEAAPAIGRVNAFACPNGLIADGGKCQVGADPRGSGLFVGGS